MYILNLIELFLGCICEGIRIRSYHLYRLITRYTELEKDKAPFFNQVILHYVKYLFEKYIPKYEHSKVVTIKMALKDESLMEESLVKKR